jgi:carboxylesterase
MKPGAVLLIHGFTSGPFAFEYLVPRLREAGLHFSAPTLRGHGLDSWKKLEGFTWRNWLEDARTALDTLALEHGPAVLIGHSMGGLLALNLASESPQRVTGLILAGAALHLASPFGPGRPLGFLQPVMKGLFRSWDMTPFYTDRRMLRSDRNYRRAPMASISSFMELVGETKEHLRAVDSPTLILQGKRDRRAHWKSAEMIKNSISTPESHKSVVMFPETDHEMFRDCEREQIINRVLDYLASVQDRTL